MLGEHPHHAPLRANLHNAAEQDAEIEASAHSVKSEDGRQALEPFRAITESAPLNVVLANDRGHGFARFGVRTTEAGNQAFARNKEQLLRASTFVQLNFRFLVDMSYVS